MSKKSSPYQKVISRLSENTNTMKVYKIAIKRYEKFHGMTMDELVCEALEEQSNRVPPHELSVIDRLEDFQQELIQQGLVYGTIREYFAKIKSIYHKCRVSIPYIEPLNSKQIKRREYISYEDVLTKEELKMSIEYMSPILKAKVLAMAQGGLSHKECESLTTRQFIDDTYKYHQCDDDIDALQWLADIDHPIIWVAQLIRVKTQKPYFALIGAEAVNSIAQSKLYEINLPKNHGKPNPRLFNMSYGHTQRTLKDINNKLRLGDVADESKLRCHNLRRFHATYIKGSVLTYEENSLLSNNEIDEMQGRGKTATQDTYIKSNPVRQKLLYAKVMNNLSLWNKYNYEITGDDIILSVQDPKKLEKEVRILTEKLRKKEEASKKVQTLKDELGEDVFKELIGEILNAS